MFENLRPSELNQNAKDVKCRLDQGEGVLLLDVREPWEVAVAKIDGSQHIPLGEIGSRFTEIDLATPVVCYCHMGVRSLQATLFLQQRGFQNVRNLAGGIDAWSVQVDPTVPRYR